MERICQAVGPNYKNALEKVSLYTFQVTLRNSAFDAFFLLQYFLLTVSLYYRTLESILEKVKNICMNIHPYKRVLPIYRNNIVCLRQRYGGVS